MATETLDLRMARLLHPESLVQGDIEAVYYRGEVLVGYPEGVEMVVDAMQRNNTVLVVGAQLGDEGKGRVVDNKIENLFKEGVRAVTVIRYQGGSNAGHTIYTKSGERVPLHQVPSGILYEEVVGVTYESGVNGD